MGFRQNQNWYLSRGSTQKKNSLHPVTDVHSVIGGVILSNVEFYDDD